MVLETVKIENPFGDLSIEVSVDRKFWIKFIIGLNLIRFGSLLAGVKEVKFIKVEDKENKNE